MNIVNVSRSTSGGIFGGLFGNPKREKVVSESYREHFRRVMVVHPNKVKWLKEQLQNGARLYCAGCGYDSPTCHARIIEQELASLSTSP